MRTHWHAQFHTTHFFTFTLWHTLFLSLFSPLSLLSPLSHLSCYVSLLSLFSLPSLSSCLSRSLSISLSPLSPLFLLLTQMSTCRLTSLATCTHTHTHTHTQNEASVHTHTPRLSVLSAAGSWGLPFCCCFCRFPPLILDAVCAHVHMC